VALNSTAHGVMLPAWVLEFTLNRPDLIFRQGR